MTDPVHLSATAMARAVRKKELSATELVQAHHRIRRSEHTRAAATRLGPQLARIECEAQRPLETRLPQFPRCARP